MRNVRITLVTFACIGLLATMAMGETGTTGTPTDPMGQTTPGVGSGSSGMGTESPGMGSPTPGMGSETQGGGSITGEILRVQDDIYVVKDSMGKEVSLHVDQSTQKSGTLQEGDRIEAEVTPDGHALSIQKADQSSR